MKYVNLVSPKLQRFKTKKIGLYNFACPYCGDSKKKNKARGYIYQTKSDLNFKCHNCGMTRSFTYFLKDIDPYLYDQYLMERYREGLTGRGTVAPDPKFDFEKPTFKKNIFSSIPKISSLDANHTARKYLSDRKIPEKYFDKLYYAEDFNSWVKEHNDEYQSSKTDSRIIIPFIFKDGTVYGYQGRSLDKNTKLRYITTILDKSYPKIYGLDSVKTSGGSLVFVTEGPFDSMFLPNAIAMAGSDGLPDELIPKNQVVMVFDNEPRNKQIVDKISRYIDKSYKVVIWPNNVHEKDINDMVLAGIDIQEVLRDNIFSSLEAKLKFNEWKKV
jgi:transcription elongation factor Elf1